MISQTTGPRRQREHREATQDQQEQKAVAIPKLKGQRIKSAGSNQVVWQKLEPQWMCSIGTKARGEPVSAHTPPRQRRRGQGFSLPFDLQSPQRLALVKPKGKPAKRSKGI